MIYCKGDGNVTFATPFLPLDKVTLDEHYHCKFLGKVFKMRYFRHIYKKTTLMALFLTCKGLNSRSDIIAYISTFFSLGRIG